MLLMIIFLPLIGSFSSGLFSWYMGRTGSSLLTTIIMFVNVILTAIFFYKISILRRIYFVNWGTWIYSDLFQINWGFYIDNLTITMLLVVNIVSTLVHLYSTDYMSQDPHLSRFMSYLSLFTFFMLMLVTGTNFPLLFLGWEGVGLCSYLLISFWYTRLQANKAAIKALVVNRIADFALTLGLISIFFAWKTLDFHVFFSLAPFLLDSTIVFLTYNWPVLTIICTLLFLGAMGKSAQIGLHTWLPDAMEGPTPVSALIHAATMVTAGVFLIIKCSPVFEHVPTVLSFITFVGATTAFFSATIGLVQNDIKKVIAYSTCSQLGYMIFACGLSNYHVSLFHLANHAFFKALLFLSAGAIIHSLSNEQDMRKYGGLILLLPFTSIMLLIGSLSLMGFPFLTGFYSKDLILELALTKYTVAGSFAYSLGLITAFFTSFYSFRVFYMTFIYKNNSFRSMIAHVHELPWNMAISLSFLSLGSIFLGYLAKDLFVGLGTDFWNHSIFILPSHNNQLEAEFFGLSNLSGFEMQSFWNTTYGQRWIKLLPFFSSLTATALVCFCFSHGLYNFSTPSDKNNNRPNVMANENIISNVLNAPYLTNKKIILPSINLVFLNLIRHSSKMVELTHLQVTKLINLYTPAGFLEAYEKTGKFIFPYPVDHPLIPVPKVIETPSYHYYQKLIWDLDKEKIILSTPASEVIESSRDQKLVWTLDKENIIPLTKDFKFNFRELYRFLTYKWYFDAIYNELLNRPLLKMAYTTIFCSLDKGVFELFGPYGFSSFLVSGASEMKRLHVGEVYYYAYFMLIFIIVSLFGISYFI